MYRKIWEGLHGAIYIHDCIILVGSLCMHRPRNAILSSCLILLLSNPYYCVAFNFVSRSSQVLTFTGMLFPRGAMPVPTAMQWRLISRTKPWLSVVGVVLLCVVYRLRLHNMTSVAHPYTMLSPPNAVNTVYNSICYRFVVPCDSFVNFS